MSDLVARLKGLTLKAWQDWPEIGDEAAAEIWRLTAERDVLRAALFRIANPLTDWGVRIDRGNPLQDCARATLAKRGNI